MKIIIAVVLFLLGYLNLFFNKTSDVKQENSILPVGTVIYSILAPNDFLVNNPNWRFLDGQALEKSTLLYDMTKISSLPDGRGLFIRSSNYLGIGDDPNSNRVIGTKQGWLTGRPEYTFKFQSTGNGLIIKDNYLKDRYVINKIRRDKVENEINFNNNTAVPNRPKNWLRRDINNECLFIDDRGYDDISTKSNIGGDQETRPANISLYSYIKVN